MCAYSESSARSKQSASHLRTINACHWLRVLAVSWLMRATAVPSSIIRSSGKHGLHVTSLAFSATPAAPEWVDFVIGSKSVYYGINTTFARTTTPVSPLEREVAHKAVEVAVRLPAQALSPLCSIEILGFTHLNDDTWPFSNHARDTEPVAGTCNLRATSRPLSMGCYYRALYENWRLEVFESGLSYWATLFYCPIHDASVCGSLTNPAAPVEVSFEVTIKIRDLMWADNFTANLYTHAPHKTLSELYDSKTKNMPDFDIGVCAAIPYTSTDTDKLEANGAILREFVKYYLRLGMRPALYDRDGANYAYIKQLGALVDDPALLYYNHTILSKLHPEHSIKYDNNEMHSTWNLPNVGLSSKLFRWLLQGNDKVLTLTQCRFELKAVFGIHYTIVADFDEFLYCPRSKPTAVEQRTAIKNSLYYHGAQSSHKMDQVTYSQRVAFNTSVSTRDCLINQVRNSGVIWKCFAPYRFVASAHSIKSAFLGHKCPLTGYHQACPTTIPRSYDCACKSVLALDCEFMHLSTSHAHFGKDKVGFRYKGEKLVTLVKEKNEIYRLLYDNETSSLNW